MPLRAELFVFSATWKFSRWDGKIFMLELNENILPTAIYKKHTEFSDFS